MVLFLMFFPDFGCLKGVFTVDWCPRNVSARSLSVLIDGVDGLKWHPLCIFFFSGLAGFHRSELTVVSFLYFLFFGSVKLEENHRDGAITSNLRCIQDSYRGTL